MFSKTLALFICLPWISLPARAQGPSEYQIKAAFLYKFARFVEWPASSFTSQASPLVIGILGEDPFGPMLDQATKGKSVQGRPLQVIRFSSLDEPPLCHLLFIGELKGHPLSQVFALLKDRSVLTVGDTEDFARSGGMIRLLMSDQRVYFDINGEAAQRAGLKISSQLLKLARSTGTGR